MILLLTLIQFKLLEFYERMIPCFLGGCQVTFCSRSPEFGNYILKSRKL